MVACCGRYAAEHDPAPKRTAVRTMKYQQRSQRVSDAVSSTRAGMHDYAEWRAHTQSPLRTRRFRTAECSRIPTGKFNAISKTNACDAPVDDTPTVLPGSIQEFGLVQHNRRENRGRRPPTSTRPYSRPDPVSSSRARRSRRVHTKPSPAPARNRRARPPRAAAAQAPTGGHRAASWIGAPQRTHRPVPFDGGCTPACGAGHATTTVSARSAMHATGRTPYHTSSALLQCGVGGAQSCRRRLS